MNQSLLSIVVAIFIGLLAVAPVGCGSEVTHLPGTTSAGGSTATGGGGTAAAGGAGAAPTICGGEAGLACQPDRWCDFEDGFCGGNDSLGTCLPRPEGCQEDCPGVCGCDRQFYCNACMAEQAGVDVAEDETCGSGGAEYSAQAWPGGLDHIIVLRADAALDTCTKLFVDAPMENSPGFSFTTPDGWGVSHGIITSAASDCDSWDSTPSGTVIDASGGGGTISWTLPQGFYYPCELDIDAQLSFSSTEPWVPAPAVLDATDVVVNGGCM